MVHNPMCDVDAGEAMGVEAAPDGDNDVHCIDGVGNRLEHLFGSARTGMVD